MRALYLLAELVITLAGVATIPLLLITALALLEGVI